MAREFPLKACVNGCGVPPCYPSFVICCECQRKITRNLQAMWVASVVRKPEVA